MQSLEKPDRKKLIIIAVVGVILLAIILYLTGLFGVRPRQMSAKKLRCVASQRVTPFGDRVLYYDGETLFCLSSQGAELWNYTLGSGAGFHASKDHVAAWVGANLHILDKSGRSTYNDRLSEDIQFARAGDKYVAAVTGPNVSPTLIVKDFAGLGVDTETVAYQGRIILDLDFFDSGEFLWVTSLDVFGVVSSTVMNIYQVGAMNTGSVELGDGITYEVLFSGGLLNVVDTKEAKLYDYRGTPVKTQMRRLVYGWQLIDYVLNDGDARMLYAPVFQISDSGQVTELRMLQGDVNKRYTLPDDCVGACLIGRTIFAFSGDSLYRADINAQRFTALKLPQQIETLVTGYIGRLTNGVALVTSGQDVYALVLP
ncbi:MAG: hypothetical protein Q4E07_02690 [Eubacteriales bacterium]|nr:hypothetical protein [Eubacteriales bacterium]